VPPRKPVIYRDGYFKVSRRLLDSSLWSDASSDVTKVFVTLLSLSQDPAGPRDGTVFIARRQLAAKCFLEDETLDRCLDVLSSPDPHSRTPAEAGRRIEALPNGYRILNYKLYHDRNKDEATSRARKNAGRIGGLRSGEARKNQLDTLKQKDSKRSIRRLRQDGDGDGDGDGDKTDTPPTDGMAGDAVAVPYFDPDDPESIAAGYVGVFNATFGRRCTVTAGVRSKVTARLRGWRAWQIVAQPLLVYALCTDQEYRDEINPEWCLRDGSHPRTSADGRTNGGMDWLEREYNRADRAVLDERLAQIARDAGVLDKLQGIGVQVRGVA
jgi:hypothetical protein